MAVVYPQRKTHNSGSLEISTFGGLSITLDGEPVTGFISRKVNALLVYLAANPREHPREVLSDLLWDDLPQDRSLSYLRTVLASLQRQLAPFVQVTRQSIAINSEANFWLDSKILDDALDLAESNWRQNERLNGAALRTLEAALPLYKGDFLQGFNLRDAPNFENWMIIEQERFRSRMIKTLQRAGQHALTHNDFDTGIARVAWLLQLDPLHEEGYRLHMRLLMGAGQRSAALAQYETCQRLLDEELGVTPEAETSALYKQIKAGTLHVEAIASTPHNLPAMRTPFVERPADVAAVLKLLDEPACRLLSLVGLGGIGKTRLAIESARGALESFPDGVYFVDCTTVVSHAVLPLVVLGALASVSARETYNEDILIDVLTDRHVLLVLDNFEHLLDGADLLSRLVTRTGRLKIIVTTRERLNLEEEWLYKVGALEVPGDEVGPDLLGDYPAVRLFMQAAQRVQPEFLLRDHAEAIRQVCRLVEGMPLALELAASWLRTMTCPMIVDEIQHNLDILSTTVRNVQERHRSIHAIFETSWRLLREPEQTLLRQLAVFSGSFDLEAARTVTGASLPLIASLVDKSLLQPVEGRLRMHKLLWQYALDRLHSRPHEQAQVEDAHAGYYAHYMQERANWHTRPQAFLQEMTPEIDNLFSAWQYCLTQRQESRVASFLRPLYYYYLAQGLHEKNHDMLKHGLNHLGVDSFQTDLSPVTARMVLLYASTLLQFARYPEAENILEHLLPLFSDEPASWEYGLTLLNIAHSAYYRGALHEARPYFERAADAFHRSGNRFSEAQTLRWLGTTLAVLGEYERALDMLQNGLRIAEELDVVWLRVHLYLALGGSVLNRLGRYSEAYAVIQNAFTLAHEQHDRYAMAIASFNLGRLAAILGDHQAGEAHCRHSIDMHASLHHPWGYATAHMHLGAVYYLAGDYTKSREALQVALASLNEIDARFIQVKTYFHLSRTELALNRPGAARDALRAGLAIARGLNLDLLVVEMLLAVAEWFRSGGDDQHAEQLATFVYHFPGVEYAIREDARRLYPAAPDQTPPQMSLTDMLQLATPMLD